jgi:hypothetical protein
MVNIHNIGTHMRVIDIINEAKVNSDKAVKDADATIARINSFLNPADPNRVQILDLKPNDPEHALTAEKLDADTADTINKGKNVERSLRFIIERWKTAMKASKDANDGKLARLITDFFKFIRSQEVNSINLKNKTEKSPTDPRDIFNMHTEPLIRLLASTDNDTQFNLAPNANVGIPLSPNQIRPKLRDKLQKYIENGTALVNIINTSNDPQTVTNATNELIALNTSYVGEKGAGMRRQAFQLAKQRMSYAGKELPKNNVKTGSLDNIKQVGINIDNFINSSNPNDRLDKDFDYIKLDLDKNDALPNGEDREWLTNLSTSIANVTTNKEANNLIKRFQKFLHARNGTRAADPQSSSWLATRHGVGKEQQLGELPDNFDKSNPLHTAWKDLVMNANSHEGRPDVSGLYKDYWTTVNNTYQWKCYLTNLDMVATDGSPYKISIDRIDSNKVYEPTNVAFCCARVNILKGNLLNNELVAMCKQILKHHGLLATSLTETAITDPCQEFVNKKGTKISITDKLIKLEKLARCISKNYKDYMYTYEIRQLDDALSVINKENKNPTSEDYAKFLYTSPEINQKINQIKNNVVKWASKYRTPAQSLLTGLTDVNRYSQMTFDDFKHDAHRIVKLQPKLRTRVDAAIRDAELFYRDADQMGQLTIKDKYAERLSATLQKKYRSQRKRERKYNKLGRYDLPISARKREKEKVEKYKPTISTDELMTIAKAQRGKCAITGLPMSAIKGSPDTVSLDRIDSTVGGYSAKNIQLVLRRVNTMKSNLPMKDFLFWCSQIYNNSAAEVTYEYLKAAVLHPLANDKDEEVNDEN